MAIKWRERILGMKKEKELISDLAAKAGVTINGRNACDIQVHNDDFYARVMREPHLGLGESYMDGWWDAPQIDECIFKVLRADLDNELRTWTMAMHFLKSAIINYQTKSRSLTVAHKHYDIGNDLYQLMLGKSMAYTCGYWKDAKNLDEAQEAKFELICKKVGLKPGMKVLDLGCGFGSFLKYAAEHYGVTGVGVNISEEQIKFAKEACQGLPIEFQLKDYRDTDGKFDRVIAIGLTEHIGHKNYRTFLEVAHRCLNDDGLFLLHTIGANFSETATDPWTDKYIFPNGHLPSIEQLGESMERLFVMEDWHNFGADYDKTLMAWHENFAASWDTIKQNYSNRFYRMWTYYLLSCAGAFRARKIELWQVVMSKKGVLGGYHSIR
jgi:cyclopropane-fatty-acyl-phospholipid synthase